MKNHKVVLGVCCSLMLVLTACSRQQSDWEKTRETNTAEAYEQFLKKYPSGEFTAQAQARAKELNEERDWQKARDTDTPEAYQAFLKQYPDGKWTEEARIRVENFTLAQVPSGPAAPAIAAPEPAARAGAPPPAQKSASGANLPAAAAAATAAGSAAKPAAASVANAAHGGRYRVQLGAFKSGARAAQARWKHLQKAFPKLLAGLSSTVVKTADGHLYRLQAGGLSEKQARAVCTALKGKSQPCIVLPPA